MINLFFAFLFGVLCFGSTFCRLAEADVVQCKQSTLGECLSKIENKFNKKIVLEGTNKINSDMKIDADFSATECAEVIRLLFANKIDNYVLAVEENGTVVISFLGVGQDIARSPEKTSLSDEGATNTLNVIPEGEIQLSTAEVRKALSNYNMSLYLDNKIMPPTAGNESPMTLREFIGAVERGSLLPVDNNRSISSDSSASNGISLKKMTEIVKEHDKIQKNISGFTLPNGESYSFKQPDLKQKENP